jgi:hypothetical protein
MGRTVTLATCTLNQWAMDFEGNLTRIIESTYLIYLDPSQYSGMFTLQTVHKCLMTDNRTVEKLYMFSSKALNI